MNGADEARNERGRVTNPQENKTAIMTAAPGLFLSCSQYRKQSMNSEKMSSEVFSDKRVPDITRNIGENNRMDAPSKAVDLPNNPANIR